MCWEDTGGSRGGQGWMELPQTGYGSCFPQSIAALLRANWRAAVPLPSRFAADINMEHYEDTILGFDPFPPEGLLIYPNKTSSTSKKPEDTFTPLGNRPGWAPVQSGPAVLPAPPPSPPSPPPVRTQPRTCMRGEGGNVCLSVFGGWGGGGQAG